MSEYNEKNCDERHDKITKEFKAVWKKIDNFDAKVWAIVVLQIMVLGGIIGVLLK